MTHKTALVTGSTGGIGQALCQSLHDEGVNVIGLSHHADNDQAWKNYACDLSDQKNIEDVLNDIYSNQPAADFLINNAGIYHAKPWSELTPEAFAKALQVNTVAPYALTQFWANKLIENKQGGICVNVASVSAFIGSVDPSYAASKAALVMLTKTMGKDLAAHNIRVNAVAPGPVKTKMVDQIPQDRRAEYEQKIPLSRFAEIEEVTSVIRFLLSDQSQYITGSTINIDGGLT